MKKILLATALLCSVSAFAQPQLKRVPLPQQIKAKKTEKPLYLDERKPIDARVQDALSRMTLQEKIRICYAQSKFTTPGVARLGIPELYMSDGPHGVRMEINWNDWGHANWTNDAVTAFPALTCLAATWNTDLALKYGKNVGEEARYRKKDILLGPGVNIFRTPLNGRNFEYMGEDPYLSGEMAVPYIRGLQSNGVACCLKHYALNNQETMRGHIDVHVSDRALYEIYLPAFKKAVIEGRAWSIMGSYNKYNGQHATHNERLIDDILKGEWGFKGAVITDWGAAHDTRESVLNGLDIEMGSYTNGLTSEANGFGYDDYYLGNEYLKMCERGEVPDSIINDKAARVLRLIFHTAMNSRKPFGSLNSEEHIAAAREIAQEGVVLLKNDKVKEGKAAEKLLPLDAKKYKKILVVGENATKSLCAGGGSSELKPKDEVSPLRGIQERFGKDCEIVYAQGYESGPSVYGFVVPIRPELQDSLKQDALNKAKEADLIIYVGGLNKNHGQDCEGGDRQSYDLPYAQDELISSLLAIQPKTVVILVSGNPVAMPWLKKAPALVQSWYLGSEAGHALADILSGDVNPSGKTIFTYANTLEDYPAHQHGTRCFPGDGEKGHEVESYDDDIWVGYRWFDTKKKQVTFPFGYGLSYTTFQYGKAVASAKEMDENGNIKVSISIKNTGSVAGKEAVQLYIGDDKASVVRPAKELKAFEKISLNPGEEKEVTFTIKADDLKFFDEQKHDWVAEKGTFKAYIGASVADIKATVPFELK